MKFVSILVEGQTEGEFVQTILNTYLNLKGLHLTITLIKTKKAVDNNPAYKGGVISYGQIERDLKPLLGNTSVAAITTMFDYYGLPTDFPGYSHSEAQQPGCYQAVAYLEKQFTDAIAHQNFIAYLSIHEFEALLFTAPEKIIEALPDANKDLISTLQDIRDKYSSPEEINKIAPPSKRILSYLPDYRKPLHGIKIATLIGIEAMLKVCPHFREWVTKLENLAD